MLFLILVWLMESVDSFAIVTDTDNSCENRFISIAHGHVYILHNKGGCDKAPNRLYHS